MKRRTQGKWHTMGVRLLRITAFVILAAALALQGYTIVIHKEGDSPLPPLFGNFPANRQLLEGQAEKDAFTFAVLGDTKSVGTFERISEELRKEPIDFVVLLGDCSYSGNEEEHRYFRAECADEYALPCPVFYVVGNHDVSADRFPISRFEQVYGPSVFSFEYQRCLFIVLRMLNRPFSNAESMAFLGGLRDVSLASYRHVFVFMHMPPRLSPIFSAHSFPESEELVLLLDELGVDYVFAGDFHGYARVELGRTDYIVTGGGGSHLREEPAGQFHHAMVIRVASDSVAERIVHVPRHSDIEDRLEKFAIVEAWPWMTKHTGLIILLDVLGVGVAVLLLGPFVGRLLRKTRTESKCA